MNAVKTNGATTLNSPVYPVLTHKNIIGSVGYVTVTWKHLPYTATKADATTYGQPAKVYYSAGTAVDD